jgi:hypothetical protein
MNCLIVQRETLGYVYSKKNKLIGNQLGSSYRYLGINSDGSAWFLICTSLISQQNTPMKYKHVVLKLGS